MEVKVAYKKITVILFYLLFLPFYTFLVYSQEKENLGPIIYIDNPTIDIGEIDEGKAAIHTFIIKNIGNKDLKIENVKPT